MIDYEFVIHPAAAVWPMLPDDELAELAADIKANGLNHAIVLDSAGEVLIDGRNRLAACRIANVEPRFERLNGQDPVAYILSNNDRRRHMTAGQRAIAVALIYPEPKRGVHSQSRKMTGDFSKQRLAEARQIVRYRDLADLVLVGKMKFDHALQQARERTEMQANADQYMAQLRAEAPDLAVRAAEEQITLHEALTLFRQRQTEAAEVEKAKRETLLRIAEGLYRNGVAFAVQQFQTEFRDRLRDRKFKDILIERLRFEGNEEIKELLAGARELAEILSEIEP